MFHQKETAGSVTSNGGLVSKKAVASTSYQTGPYDAKAFAAAIIAARLRLTPSTANVIVELAHLGGRLT